MLQTPPLNRHTTGRPPSGSASGIDETLCSCAPTTTCPLALTSMAMPVRRRSVAYEVLNGVGRTVTPPAPPLACASQIHGRHWYVSVLIVVPEESYVEM